jgi:hypothetical protein
LCQPPFTAVGLVISTRTTNRIHAEKLKFDENLAERKFRFDIDLADRRFRYERQLNDDKRRIEFGEDLLAAFYKFQGLVGAVRSPGAFGDEGASRQKDPDEPPEQARLRDTCFVPRAVKPEPRFIAQFFSKRYRARALFRDSEIDQAFNLANEARHHSDSGRNAYQCCG